ncbi:MAG: BrnA antitoxin family protein [Treponema sp.]|nr:BrnA antitoxin family protein [Treponema sp.]
MTSEQFFNSPLDEEEQWHENHFDEFKPSSNQDELRKQAVEAAKRSIMERREKRQISLKVNASVVAYFKRLADETGVAYQTLINMYLVQCEKEGKKPVFV